MNPSKDANKYLPNQEYLQKKKQLLMSPLDSLGRSLLGQKDESSRPKNPNITPIMIDMEPPKSIEKGKKEVLKEGNVFQTMNESKGKGNFGPRGQHFHKKEKLGPGFIGIGGGGTMNQNYYDEPKQVFPEEKKKLVESIEENPRFLNPVELPLLVDDEQMGLNLTAVKSKEVTYEEEAMRENDDDYEVKKNLMESLNEGKFPIFQFPTHLPFDEYDRRNKEKLNPTMPRNSEHKLLLPYLIATRTDSVGFPVTEKYDKMFDFKSENSAQGNQKTKNNNEKIGMRLGKLQVLKNKVRFKLGNNEYDVMNGVNSHFKEEVALIENVTTDPTLYFLKDLDKKFVLKPNFDDLLK